MLTIHHLGKSQSERILWLCEELGVPYALEHHVRDPQTQLSPPALKALHPLGAAPVIVDDGLVLAESGAIVDYIIAKYGGGRLTVPPTDPAFPDYLYWFHFANGNLQPNMGRNMVLGRVGLPPEHPVLAGARGRLERNLDLLEARLRVTRWLAGDAFTAADVMLVFSLTTMRHFTPLDLSPYPAILAYLQRVGERDGYRRAMRRGDPDLKPMLT